MTKTWRFQGNVFFYEFFEVEAENEDEAWELVGERLDKDYPGNTDFTGDVTTEDDDD